MIGSSIRRTASGLLGAAFALALAPAIFATTWVTLTPAQLREQSEVVAFGTVTAKVAVEIAVPWFSDPAGDMIYTRYEMRVEKGMKGAQPGDTVTFVSMGGTIGDRTVDVAGAPHFAVGDKIVGGFFENSIGRLQPHWGGVNRVLSTPRGPIVVGQAGHTYATNQPLENVR